MNIVLIGYGSMGKAVERVAIARGHRIARTIDHEASAALSAESLEGADVVIDFSSADAVVETVRACAEAGVPLVEGTTGWYGRMDEVRKIAEGAATKPFGFLWSPNFSIGVHMYLKIVAEAAKLIDRAEEYDIWGHEIHHAGKADSPSGTAKALEKILLEKISRKKTAIEEKLDRKRADSEIHFSSVRGGMVNFGHTIGFDSAADRILISHEARSRDGYALGAVKAAEWLRGKVGFFSMEDYMRDIFPV